jgi:hypothetical protein
MPQIGHNQELDFPQNVVLLADKIYPNGYPLMTPYTRRQLNARSDNVRRKCRKLRKIDNRDNLKTCIKVYDVYGHLKGIIHC